MRIPAISGLIPSSLLVNINYKKFSKLNGFEEIDQNVNVISGTTKGFAKRIEIIYLLM